MNTSYYPAHCGREDKYMSRFAGLHAAEDIHAQRGGAKA